MFFCTSFIDKPKLLNNHFNSLFIFDFKSLAAIALALMLFFSSEVSSAKVKPFGNSNISSKPNPFVPLHSLEINPFNIPSPTISFFPS